MAILLVLPTLTIYGCRHNPTVYGRRVSINRDGFKHVYWNEQILDHAKHVEQVIALDIIENYENVESIRFTDVYQNKYYFESPDSSNRFEVEVLINTKPPMMSIFPQKTLTIQKTNMIKGLNYIECHLMALISSQRRKI